MQMLKQESFHIVNDLMYSARITHQFDPPTSKILLWNQTWSGSDDSLL